MRKILTKLFVLSVFLSCDFSYSSTAIEKNNAMAAKSNVFLKKSTSIHEFTFDEVTALLMNERFKEFEAKIKEYENNFIKDSTYEIPFDSLFRAINGSDPYLLEKLNKWVVINPSHISYCARGFYKYKRGYYMRGDQYINQTPVSSILKMEELHNEAKNDFLKSISLNNKFQPARLFMIETLQTSGDVKEIKKLYDESVNIIPETYSIRYAYLGTLRPRWGGSYSKMQAYADKLDNAAKLNPRIWGLKAEAAADRGYMAWSEKNYDQAIKHYTEALAYGDRLEFLDYRGTAYMYTNKHDLALKDYQKYFEYDQSNERIKKNIEKLKGYVKTLNNTDKRK